jgi:hypothetical protein
MASSNYRYKRLGADPVTGPIYRPIIPVEITKKKLSFPVEALLDTGADFSIFSGEIAKALDIELSSGTPNQIIGVGGAITKGFIHRIGITIPGLPTYNSWGFFSDELNDMNHAILGQLGFFECFKVSFEYKKKLIVVREK